MKRTIFTIFIILMAIATCMNSVSAQNETEMMMVENEEESKSRIDEEVKSTENGNFNITFNDNYNGYCIDYGKHEATEGDSFIVKDTSYAVNHDSGEEVGNYLKIYFVDYYEHAMKNEIVTQHTIWHFTDNFNGWRLDYDLIEDIKNTALTKTIPDHGAVKKINNTTEMVFDFEVLYSGIEGHQNFFGYKVTYRDIVKEIQNNQSAIKNPLLNSSNDNNYSNNNDNNLLNSSNDNNYSNNSDNNLLNISNNNTPSSEDKIIEDPKSNNPTNESESNITHKNTIPKTTGQIEDDKNSKNDTNNPEKSVNLSKHVTGQKMNIGILMLLILLTIVAIKYIRRD